MTSQIRYPGKSPKFKRATTWSTTFTSPILGTIIVQYEWNPFSGTGEVAIWLLSHQCPKFDLYGSSEVKGHGNKRKVTYDFLLVFYSNHASIMHRYRVGTQLAKLAKFDNLANRQTSNELLSV